MFFIRVQTHPNGTMQKEEGQLRYQLTLFFLHGVPKGIKQKGKETYLIEIPFELKTAA